MKELLLACPKDEDGFYIQVFDGSNMYGEIMNPDVIQIANYLATIDMKNDLEVTVPKIGGINLAYYAPSDDKHDHPIPKIWDEKWLVYDGKVHYPIQEEFPVVKISKSQEKNKWMLFSPSIDTTLYMRKQYGENAERIKFVVVDDPTDEEIEAVREKFRKFNTRKRLPKTLTESLSRRHMTTMGTCFSRSSGMSKPKFQRRRSLKKALLGSFHGF
jgi:hypothetical protein